MLKNKMKSQIWDFLIFTSIAGMKQSDHCDVIVIQRSAAGFNEAGDDRDAELDRLSRYLTATVPDF